MSTTRRRIAALLIVAAMMQGCSVPLPVPPATVARYDFDEYAEWHDRSGRGPDLTVAGNNTATAVHVPHGRGRAIRFPEPCRVKPCPRLILRTPSRPDLQPGSRDLRFGASVRLAPEFTSEGQNVLQKGYSTEGSQYKLQIDGYAGRPSCVLVGAPDRLIRRAVADVIVSDGRWHRLECRRTGTAFLVLVDGTPRGAVPVPSGLTVADDDPLLIGGKSVSQSNDQFHGSVDDVWIAID
ncbi:LamG-like jellyroll fold domain-containing protein [Actinoplanes sp. GCM10030250]|uniref:LamG-like jellyroll fold domain-containing protein n=1 Tax=Actinoplanes sp. GCM10030250 TaxID=3273376 RepID=UPI0036121713